MIEILLANVVFWAFWFGVSNIPFLITQYAIDNYEEVIKWKRQLS